MTENGKSLFFYGYIIASAAFFIQALMWGTFNTFGVFFMPLSIELGLTRTMTSGARSLSLLLIGLFGIIAGRLTDRFGPRVVVTICGFLLGFGYLLMSQINTSWHFYLFYGVMVGIGMSGANVPLLSTVAKWFVKKRGVMTGIAKAGSGMGILLMPLLANWLISNYGWRTGYVIVGLITLVLIIAIAQSLRRDPSQMGMLPDGSTVQKGSPKPEAKGVSFQQAIRTRQFWILSAVYFIILSCVQTVFTHLYPHAVDIGLSEAIAANILATIGGASIVSPFIMGSAADRIGNKLVIVINLIILAAALLWLSLAREAWTLYLFAAIFGMTLGGLLTLMSPLIAELFGLSSHGVIFGGASFISTIGASVGPIMAGYIFDITGSYQLGFIILGVAVIIAILLAINIKVKRHQHSDIPDYQMGSKTRGN